MKSASLSVLLVIVCIGLSGCHLGQIPDSNDPLNGGDRAGVLLLKKMKQTSDLVNERQASGEITPAQGTEILAVQAGDELDRLKGLKVPAETAWQFAEVAITARRWPLAEKYLEIAQKFDQEKIKKDPNDQDRFVNDTLRLARAQAAQGKIDEALKTARTTFEAPPHWKWPILYAVYLEIAPAAEEAKPGNEVELGQFVEEGIKQHIAAQGDYSNPREAGWVSTRNFHIRAAWLYAAKLYEIGKRPDLVAKALKQADLVPHASKT